MNKALAIHGGHKTIDYLIPKYKTIGHEEQQAVNEVLDTGVLSDFIGSWDKRFYGGNWVRRFEADWAHFFKTEYAISINSATSGLIIALGAIDLSPQDEVIVSPFTMSASATPILVWNAIPVFCDIDSKTFNLDPKAIEKKITPKTKAIIIPHIFGHPADMDEIMTIAKQHKLWVIEDTAQSPGATIDSQYAGTIGDIGVFSLNCHKHITTGEGGICVTNNPTLAERMQLIRNHAEAVVSTKPTNKFHNLIGFNFRLGEMEAAIGVSQLKKLPKILEHQNKLARVLNQGLSTLEHLSVPTVLNNYTHVYCIYACILGEQLAHKRTAIANALKAEGIPGITEGYLNIHTYPIYQNKIAYGHSGYPWKAGNMESTVSYEKGEFSVAEKFHNQTMLNIPMTLFQYCEKDIELIVQSFHKVWNNLDII